jgi:hypothetical protein
VAISIPGRKATRSATADAAQPTDWRHDARIVAARRALHAAEQLVERQQSDLANAQQGSQAADANARATELYGIAAQTFPLTLSSGPNGHPRTAGLNGALLWPDLDTSERSRLGYWRRMLVAAGLVR